jgi:hypothetical protein
MTNLPEKPAGEPDRCADIAAALHLLAVRFTDLIGSGLPVPHVQLNIQPGRHGDDESVVGAVDAVTSALLFHVGQVQPMTTGGHHYNNGDTAELVGPVGVRIFQSVSPEYAARREAAVKLAEREAELERLRAEVEQLRAEAKPAEPVTETGERVEIGADGCGCPVTEEVRANSTSIDGTERVEHRSGCWNAAASAE